MKKIEYKVATYQAMDDYRTPQHHADLLLEEWLNGFGAEGWRVVDVHADKGISVMLMREAGELRGV